MSETTDFSDAPLLVAHDQPELYLGDIEKRFPELTFEACTTAESLVEALAEHQPRAVLSYKCPGIPGPAHRPILDCPSVKWIHVGGTGIDHLHPWDSARLTVTNSAGVLSPFLAETVLGAMLMMNFGFPGYLQQQRHKIWQGRPWRPLQGQTLLVVGLGNIGRQVAAKAKAFGLRVLGVRATAAPLEQVDEMLALGELHQALARADFVSLHVPMTPATRHLINGPALAAMQPHAVLLNTSRGPVVDEAALIAALQADEIAGAYLDVFETEPLPADNILWSLENVVISPHCADSVSDWQARFAGHFADNLGRWLKGQPLLNVVDPARGY
jgi:phosphoglycerate dehydrogenase-like enzyme